jgi:lipopolysaccharide/colanic/teichoic acid biosynthesis glycosyltransferase
MLKRFVDVTISAIVVSLTSPIWLAAAAAIWIESGRPILFRQQRVGRGFTTFKILKFRTMSPAVSGPSVTVAGDKRITRVGRFLRATKVDELPQFWNVLRGDMSIVGPRPELQHYVELFRQRYDNILTVRPGITDLASIRYRNEEEILARSDNPLRCYQEEVLPRKLDLADQYLRERSTWRDAIIIAKTVFEVLAPSVHYSDIHKN